MKSAIINLPYFKQGDDLGHHLSQCLTTEAALEAHASQLEEAVQMLRNIKTIIAGKKVDIQANTHMIIIEGPAKVISTLVDAGYASFDDEDWDDLK